MHIGINVGVVYFYVRAFRVLQIPFLSKHKLYFETFYHLKHCVKLKSHYLISTFETVGKQSFYSFFDIKLEMIRAITRTMLARESK